MAKLTLNDITSGYASATAYNTNNTLIENALENTLSLDGTAPNAMTANLDMNSNRVINLSAPVNPNDAARLQDVQSSVVGGIPSPTLISWTQSATGAVARTVQGKLEEFVSVEDFGAGGGVVSDVTAFQNAVNSFPNGSTAIIIVPRNAYIGDFSTLTYGSRNVTFVEQGQVTYSIAAPIVTRTGTSPQYGTNLFGNWITGSQFMYSKKGTSGNSVLRVRSNTTEDPSISNTAYIERLINHDSGLNNPHALRVNTQVNVDTVANEWAVSADVQTSSNGTGNVVAVSGVTTREAPSLNNTVFSGHFVTQDSVTYASPNDVSPTIGTEFGIGAKGLDHPTANGGQGRRTIVQVVPRSVAPFGSPAGDNAEIGRGIGIATENEPTGAVCRTALHIYEAVLNPNPIHTAIQINTTGSYGIRSANAHTISDIQLNGNSPYGIVCAGAYANAAIRVGDNDYIGLRDNNAIKFRYDTATGTVDWYNGANDRFSYSLGATPYLALNLTQVVTTRRTGYTNAMIGVANRATAYDTATITLPQLAERVKALQDDLTTHGLIGV